MWSARHDDNVRACALYRTPKVNNEIRAGGQDLQLSRTFDAEAGGGGADAAFTQDKKLACDLMLITCFRAGEL